MLEHLDAGRAAPSVEQELGALARLMDGLALTPERVESAEHAMLAQPQLACPVTHHFGPGMYFREVRMAAGTFAIGHHQRCAHFNLFLQGRVTVIKDDGSTDELVAPMMFIGQPGRKIGYVHEDVVWLNAYATAETDIDTLEALFLIKSPTWQACARQRAAAGKARRQIDRDDFTAAIAELGFCAETVRRQSENVADQVPMPFGHQQTKIGDSAIEGRGLIATADFAVGAIIAPARVGGMRTPAGRFTNHAKSPNARMALANAGGDIHLVAIAPIVGCRGGADGDEITVDYRQAVALNLASQRRETPCQE
ncbi:hypothetical protein AAKU55_004610 [Oxalobacteraceae bacterium GrIS 1.11]